MSGAEPSKAQQWAALQSALGLVPPGEVLQYAKFKYTSHWLFNRPQVEGHLDGVETIYLFDSGSDFSIVSSGHQAKFAAHTVDHNLAQFIHCVPFNYASMEDENYNHADLPPLRRVVTPTFRMCGIQVKFPFYVFERNLSVVILGNDFMTLFGMAPHPDTSDIWMRYLWVESHQRALDNQPYLFRENKIRQNRSNVYLKQLLLWRGKSGVSLLISVNAEGTPEVTPRTFQPKEVEGVWLMPDEQLLYPTQSTILIPTQTKKVEVRANNYKFRPGFTYRIQSVERAPFYDVSLAQEIVSYEYTHQGEDSDTITLSLTTVSGVELRPQVACAIANRISITMVTALQKINEDADSGSTDPITIYPEVSSFKPQPYGDYPFPDENGDWQPVEDWTEEEIVAAEAEYDNWVKEENGQIYLCPKPLVKLKHNYPGLRKGQLVLATKMISMLPTGVWYQEEPNKLPGIAMVDVAIRVKLTSNATIYKKVARMGQNQLEVLRAEMKKNLDMQIYEHCSSPNSCNLTWAPKPNNQLRMCVNFKPINKVMVKDRYPLPRMEDMLGFIRGAKFLSSTDIKLGFHNLYIHLDDRWKLAFSTPEGQYQPARLLFGWCNGPSIFMRQMHVTLQGMQKSVAMYLDDAVIRGGENTKEHMMQFCTIAYNIHQRGLKYEADKAQILCNFLSFLGFVATPDGIHPPNTLDVFLLLMGRKHATLKAIQRTMGTLQWFRRFVPNFSYVVRPIQTQLTKASNVGSESIVFDDKCIQAIKTVQDYVQKLTLLHHPDPYTYKSVFLTVGNYAFAVSVWQSPTEDDASKLQILAFWSKVWPLNVDNYLIIERYASAVRETLVQFDHCFLSAPAITFFCADVAFTTSANNPKSWTSRMQRFLVMTYKYDCKFNLSNNTLCRQLEELNAYIPTDDKGDEYAALEQLLQNPRFADLKNPVAILHIPIVYVDGAYASTSRTTKLGSWAIYWRRDNPRNQSGVCQYPDYSNNRAELEAAIHAVEGHCNSPQKDSPLIIASDSAYLCNGVNHYSKEWRDVQHLDNSGYDIVNSTGVVIDNVDLWKMLLPKL